LTHAIHKKRPPSYLSDAVQTVATATTRCGFRSCATADYVVLRSAYTFQLWRASLCVYRIAGPAAWNRLPSTLVDSPHLQPLEDFENVLIC